jgi:hypothetical protein
MTRATARVELHLASAADYLALHGAMDSEGFSRIVVATDGSRYQLPPGEYVHASIGSLDDARTRAMRASTRTGRASSIFVAGWDGSWASQNLTRV